LDTSVSAVVAFAVTSLILVYHASFRTLFSHGKKKKSCSDKCRECCRCAKVITLCLAKYFLTTNIRYAGALSSRRNWLFHVHFWGHLLLTTSLRHLLGALSPVSSHYVVHMLYVFVMCRGRWSLIEWIVTDTCLAITITFLPLVHLHFLHCCLAIRFSKHL
jgi:hypothetical protein